ncbi:ABC transporter ATP-binding protein [Paenibacillus apiarius]|uniref:ABC transporter ATP-binding protein/permease n=1 Tax=Paenibacillus apiarius TaxID=46240 RepID=A0ABT4DMY7_9BACL|nr:ABC transporter ATP-binding protein [Paenibacillus apiarius]MCY9514737.1 ABC transporter ATP-binding protein/permease [Paenibacillus apiarius]MCY9518727.1 ABC transporter ATP-binding protein/permease [Paenibacillus apiarius]MCY9552832.1 ABC transporter ATP-binding protein/permease [Paenibacillus apiarius]MCY9556857.1 ABC transporter ATP-binding protein/permease [Paenibacillus apiarius]MCY9686190.1 ABC transporter ATP-binding protein/permease [Paenibacillus apiarius]
MRKVLSFLNPYRRPMGIALFLMLIELTVELWHPLIAAKIINEGITQKDLSVVLSWGGAMVALALLGFVCGIINSFYAARVSQNFGFDIRNHLFEKIQSFSFANFDRFSTATLITRVTSDVTQMQNVVFMSLRIIMRAPLLVVGSLIMALAVNVKLGLILAVVMPLLLALLVWIMNKGFVLFRSVQEKLDQANGVLRENLLGMRLIKAFVRHHHENKRFAKSNEELMAKNVAALRLVELTIPLLLLIMNLSVLGILWFGHLEVKAGGVNVGEVVAIVNYVARMTGAMSMVSMIMMVISRAKASGQRVAEVLGTAVDVTDSAAANASLAIRSGKVAFEDVSFRYPGTELPVLQSITFTAQPSETVAILGATGSGKTSLFQLIPRLYDVNGGRVRIDDMDIRTMKLDMLRRSIGFVPQEALLFSGTVMDNIKWGKEGATTEEVIAATRSAQIHDTIMKLPQQYDTVLGQKGVNLSGGQKQRLSIARALIRKPAILLLDDSTSALDVKTEAGLLASLQEYPCTTLIITQKISTALQADTILLLEDGKLLAQGNHASLLQHSEMYRRIVQSQYGEGVAIHANAGT